MKNWYHKIPISLFFYFIFSLKVYALLTEDSKCYVTSLNQSKPDILSFVRLAKKLDYMHDFALTKFDPQNYIKTPYGSAQIHRNCFKDLTPKAALLKKYAIELAIGKTILQSKNCHEVFGLPSLKGITSIIRRLKLSCKNKDDQQDIFEGGALTIKKYLWGLIQVNATFSRDYKIELMLENINTKNFQQVLLPLLLIHEGLHFGALNNRKNHSSNFADKSIDQCKNNLWEDRIYFTGGVCNPTSKLSKNLFNNILKCPNLCIKALTSVDKNLKYKKVIYGENLISKPMKIKEAKLFCMRIKRIAHLNVTNSQLSISTEKKFETFIKKLIKLKSFNFIYDKKSLFYQYKDHLIRAFNYFGKYRIKEINRSKLLFKSFIKQLDSKCHQHPKGTAFNLSCIEIKSHFIKNNDFILSQLKNEAAHLDADYLKLVNPI